MGRALAVLGKLNLHAGRRTAVAGVLAAAGSMVYLVLDDHANVYTAFIKGLLAGILAMAFLGFIANFWANRKVASAKVQTSPDGGAGAEVSFEDRIADAVAEVNERMNEQIGIIDRRLYDLEQGRVQRTEPEADG